MNILAIVLVVFSALIHSLWNLMSKKSGNKVVFNWYIVAFASIFYFPLFLYFILTESIPLIGWVFIIASAIFVAFYLYFLAKAYSHGNLSLAYPLSRSSIIFIPFLAFLFIGERMSPIGISGIVVILFGIYVLHLKSFKLKSFLGPLKYIKKKATIFALLTALFAAFYSVVDKVGVTYVSPFLYIYLILAVVSIIYLPIIFSKNNRKDIKPEWKNNKKSIFISAFFVLFSYVLILFALRIEKVGIVFALRQLSVLFAILFGSFLLKEKYGLVRLVASAIMIVGFIMVSLA